MSSYGGTNADTIDIFPRAVDRYRGGYDDHRLRNDNLVFAAGASANVAPLATIEGAATTPSNPEGLWIP